MKKDDGGYFNANDWNEYEGISRRDWLAGLAMSSVSGDNLSDWCGGDNERQYEKSMSKMAEYSYDLADAMIKKGKE
jgi:hypothetical protein